MFWSSQRQQQQQPEHQQQQHHHLPPKRFNFSFNLRIAVNVHTKMSSTHVNCMQQKPNQKAATTKDEGQDQHTTTTTTTTTTASLAALPTPKTLAKLHERLGNNNNCMPFNSLSGQSGNGYSLLVMMNILLLLVLTLCCGICKSEGATSIKRVNNPANMTKLLNVANQNYGMSTTVHTAVDSMDITAKQTVDHMLIDMGSDGAVEERITLENVTRACLQHCIVEEDLFLDEYGIKCEKADNREKCYKTRCTKGCAQWYRALKEFEPCHEACRSMEFYPYDLPCISACEMAQRDYWHLQRLAMEKLVLSTRPLIRGIDYDVEHKMVTGMGDIMSRLTLKWPIIFPDSQLASRPFDVQYQYVIDNETDAGSSPWSNLAEYDCDENFVCEILEGLMPYTRYRFRFELPFGESNADVLFSPPTTIMQTPAEGAPISEPIIERALAIDHAHLAVFWKPGRFINAPLQKYRLVLQNIDLNFTIEALVTANQTSYVFSELIEATNFTIRISMLNVHGEGSAAITHAMTKPLHLLKSGEVSAELSNVLIAGEYSIKLKSLEPLVDTRVLYQTEEMISDMAFSQAAQRLFVIDGHGDIFSLFIQQTDNVKALKLNQNSTMYFKPAKITLDWLRQRLYIAGETKEKTWSIASCDFDGHELTYLKSGLKNKLLQLEVDPLNGWLFWTQAAGGIQSMNLNTGDVKILHSTTNFGPFTFDPQLWLIFAYNKSAEALYELSYDGSYSGRIWPSTSEASLGVLQGAWQSFAHYSPARMLLITNGSQLVRYNYHTNELDTWALRDLEWCWKIVPLERGKSEIRRLQQQPLALEPLKPQRLQALLTSNMARIQWEAPPIHPLQTKASWQLLEYELEIMDVVSNSGYNIRNIKSTYFNVEKLQANNLYRMRVRATNRVGVAGEWTAPLITRTWPLGAHRLRWIAKEGVLYETNEIGGDAKELGSLGAKAANALVTINGTIYYVAGGQLLCANIMNPELNCTFGKLNAEQRITVAGSLAYDWRGGQLYWTDLKRDCVVRGEFMDTGNGHWQLLPIFGAIDIQIDSQQGHIYYTTQTRLARRTLSGSVERDEVEYYHVNGFTGTIRAFTLDLQQHKIYWIVYQHEGGVRLFRSALTASKHDKLMDHVLPVDCMSGTLQYLEQIEALLWLTNDGRQAAIARTMTPTDVALLNVGDFSTGSPATVVQLSPDFTPYSDSSVVPQAVALESIRIDDGYWDDFNIKWAPITTAENYSVFYNVLLEYDGKFHALEVTAPFVRITDLQQAALSLNISVTPHTAWRIGSTTRAELNTPAAAPTQPKRLRVFIERRAQPLEVENISALIRWDTPEHVGGQQLAVAYRVFCWHDDELFAERVHNYTEHQPLEVRITGLRPDETYTFQVQAFVAGRSSGGEKTSYHAVHISPEVQAVPRLVFATTEYIGELDLDTNARRSLVHTTSVVEHLVMMPGEQRLLWVNENVELMTYVPGMPPVKLARMRAEVLALTVDWIARNVYWAEMDTDVPDAVAIYRLELCQFEGRVMHGQKLWSTAQGHLLRDLFILPHAQSLLWLENEIGVRNATLVGRNLSDGSMLYFKTPALLRMYEGSYEPESETLNLIDHKGKLCAYDVQRQLCTTLKTHFNLLADDIIDLTRDAGYLYALKNNSIRAYNRRKQQLEYLVEISEARMVRAYNYQPYPPRKCLLMHQPTQPQMLTSEETDLGLNAATEIPKTPLHLSTPALLASGSAVVSAYDESFITLQLPRLNTHEDCQLPLPGLKYQLNITNRATTERRALSTTYTWLNITSLESYTDYAIDFIASSYYQQKLNQPVYVAPTLRVRTAPGAPTSPQNFSAKAISPTEIEVTWVPPEIQHSESIWYVLHWQADNGAVSDKKFNETVTSYTISGLTPATSYGIWLQAFATPQKYSTSARVHVETYDALNALQLLNATAYNLTLSWPVNAGNLSSLILICQALNGDEANEFSLDITSNYTHIVVIGLEPKTKYEFYLQLLYDDITRPYHWPTLQSDRFVFETLGDCPSSPGKPQIEHIAGEIFRVFWEPARNNGAPIVEYSLEALQARIPKRKRREAHYNLLPWAEEPVPIEDQWIVYCNTTDLSCIVRDLHTMRLLMFRVRARNQPYGWGAYSDESERIAEPFVSFEKRGSLVLAIIAPAVIVSGCVLALYIIRKVQMRRMRAKKMLEKSRPSVWSTLSAQQMIATRNRALSMISRQSGGPLSDADIALMPQVKWDQLTLVKFLGSGAFGEVYEGLYTADAETKPERVAIKSLRKRSNAEFIELLQEAQLMSNFVHENIIRLRGVCFASESLSLVMEFMEGGDLLSYLRESRPSPEQPEPTLQLLDILSMCIDVAIGCSYLEEMHFVHRDLACRNCLVSSRTPSKRVVKIGDFGLARDVYNSDYYRKEGEGLLPVRWMSPESLIDGIYTTQSDAWAFGVLCWEILTLGQQPYAARNNFEVLNYVKEGGRLEKPENCPDSLYELMLQCWRSNAEQRPSFRRCVNVLLAVKTEVRRLIWGGGNDSDYVSYVNNQQAPPLSSILLRPLPDVKEEETLIVASATTTDTIETAENTHKKTTDMKNTTKCVGSIETNNENGTTKSVCFVNELNDTDRECLYEEVGAKSQELHNRRSSNGKMGITNNGCTAECDSVDEGVSYL